jgi:hypothetical protein
MKGKYLITTDAWFIAPDGKQYKSVWGEVKIVDDSILGIKTNKNSSNWFAIIGNEDRQVIIAGCQIHYAIKSEEKPNNNDVLDYQTSVEKGCIDFKRPTQIWIAS